MLQSIIEKIYIDLQKIEQLADIKIIYIGLNNCSFRIGQIFTERLVDFIQKQINNNFDLCINSI